MRLKLDTSLRGRGRPLIVFSEEKREVWGITLAVVSYDGVLAYVYDGRIAARVSDDFGVGYEEC